MVISFRVQVGDGAMDGVIESVHFGEGFMGEIEGFEVMPDHFDVVEFGRIFRQPFDGEPVVADCQRRPRRLADVDRTVVEHDDDGLRPHAGFGAQEFLPGRQRM